MTKQTWETSVIAIVVFELRMVSSRRMRKDSLIIRVVVAHTTVLRQWRELTLLVMTRKAVRVSQRSRLSFSLRFRGFVTVSAICVGMFVVWERDTKL
jgi:hypothetical protein